MYTVILYFSSMLALTMERSFRTIPTSELHNQLNWMTRQTSHYSQTTLYLQRAFYQNANIAAPIHLGLK